MQHVVRFLPELCREVRTLVSSDVNVFHFLALAYTKKIDDVEVLEVSTNVVSKIHAVSWVATRCSPVGGMSLQRFHLHQTQAVYVPVLSVLVHWGVLFKGGVLKSGKRAIFVTPGHDQGPYSTGLRLQITVG